MIHLAIARIPFVLALGSGLALSSAGCSSGNGVGGPGAGDDGGAASGVVSCGIAPASEVGADLGLSDLGNPTSDSLAPVTECTYVSPLPTTVLIRYETQMTMADFQTGEQGFTGHGESATVVTGVGDAAYWSSLGTGSDAINTLVVLKGSTEVEIAASVPLASLEKLATQIIASF